MKYGIFRYKQCRLYRQTMFGMLLLPAIFTCTQALQAQVTIGTGIEPVKGALLDLKNNEPGEDNVSADKGIVLPRVKLDDPENMTNMHPIIPLNDPEWLDAAKRNQIKKEHTGLMVYNLFESPAGTAENKRFEKGIYTWDGLQWVPMISKTTINTMRIPEPVIFQLISDQTNFLNNVHAGVGKGFFVTTTINSIPGKIILGMASSGIGSKITFKPGVYQITFIYEAETNAPDCTLSSYFIDFPNTGGGTKRIHSTAVHGKDQMSNHSGTVMYSFKTNTDVSWDVHLGRGQSGNCWDQNRPNYHDNMKLIAGSTHISIVRLGDYY